MYFLLLLLYSFFRPESADNIFSKTVQQILSLQVI